MKLNLDKATIKKYFYLITTLVLVFWCMSTYEIYFAKSAGTDYPNIVLALFYKCLNDVWTVFIVALILFPIYTLLDVFSKKLAVNSIFAILILIILVQFSLVKYSLTTLINLGADILGYSFSDAFGTVSASESISITYFLPFIVFPGLFIISFLLLKRYIVYRSTFTVVIILVLISGISKLISKEISNEKFQNKIAYLASDIFKYKRDKQRLNAYKLNDREDYPLLTEVTNTKDVLSPFFNSKNDKPNIVVIIVEGLGSEYVANKDYSGFTPYLDSLIEQSLYWENYVSTTGRSFGILPSLLGSLPFGEKGFLELKDVPSHLSLISLLKHNGYYTSYYSGGASSFDRKVNFLEYHGVQTLVDENKYDANYSRTKNNEGGFSWGYPDSEIFKRTLVDLSIEKQPRLDIVVTLSNHEPFEYPDKESYISKAKQIAESSNKSRSFKERVLNYEDIFGCLLYTDDAIKDFMQAYAKRPDYDNTIFVITGDHRLIPMTQKDKLCRFHVPFIIYSPMLKAPKKFKGISSHWDFAPSLTSYLFNNFKFKPIKYTSWLGKGLDTSSHFRNTKNIPLMRYKGAIKDMIYKDYLYADGDLFKINENFGTYQITDEELKKTIEDTLFAFKKMNAYVTQRNKIYPDSLNIYVTPKVKFTQEQLAQINKHAEAKNMDEVLFIARDLSFNKDYNTARLLCDYILNEFPNYTDARILKGRSLAWEGEYKKAEKELLNALERSPYYDDAYLALLDMYWWSEQENKSKEIFDQAITNQVLNPDVSFKMAKAYSRLDEIDKANILMDSILKIYPEVKEYETFKSTLK